MAADFTVFEVLLLLPFVFCKRFWLKKDFHSFVLDYFLLLFIDLLLTWTILLSFHPLIVFGMW